MRSEAKAGEASPGTATESASAAAIKGDSKGEEADDDDGGGGKIGGDSDDADSDIVTNSGPMASPTAMQQSDPIQRTGRVYSQRARQLVACTQTRLNQRYEMQHTQWHKERKLLATLGYRLADIDAIMWAARRAPDRLKRCRTHLQSRYSRKPDPRIGHPPRQVTVDHWLRDPQGGTWSAPAFRPHRSAAAAVRPGSLRGGRGRVSGGRPRAPTVVPD